MAEIKINISENGHSKKCWIVLCVVTLFHVVSVCVFWVVACFGISVFFSIPERLLSDPLVDMVKRFTPLYLTNWNFSYMKMKARLDIGLKDGLLLRTAFHALCCDMFYFLIRRATVLKNSLTEEHMKIDKISTVFTYSNFLLTNWNLIFQTVFLTMSLVYDVLEWMNKHETNIGQKLKYYRDILFKGAVLPVTMFVSTMFWTIYWIDRELVFPKVYDQIVPWWFNHCVHTNIAIVVLVETVLQERRHPTNRKIELFLDGFIGVFYAIVYYSIYFFAHRWLYGVFEIMNWWQICIYQLVIWASMIMFYYLQFPVNRIFHSEPVMEQKNGIPEIKNGIDENGIPEDKNPDLKFSTNRQVENSSL